MDNEPYKDKIVLVIDDQEPVRLLIISMLEARGFGTVFGAVDPIDAIEQLADIEPDLILCDYMMPYLNGLDFVAALRLGLTDASAETPLIMLTADADQRKVQAAAWLKVQNLVRKPVSAELLAQKIADALANPPKALGSLLAPGPVIEKLDTARAARAKAL
ncbi:MAG: response regulator [Pseudomonadota bacterium]